MLHVGNARYMNNFVNSQEKYLKIISEFFLCNKTYEGLVLFFIFLTLKNVSANFKKL